MTLAVHSPDDGAWFITEDGKVPADVASAQRFALVDQAAEERRDYLVTVAASAFDALDAFDAAAKQIEGRMLNDGDPARPEAVHPTLDDLLDLLAPLRADLEALREQRVDAGF